MTITKYSLRLVKDEEFEMIGNCNNSQQIYQICCKIGLTMCPEEHVWLLMMNSKLDIIGVSEISHGGISESLVEIGSIYKRALLCNASSIILVHNHPTGDLEPSDEDFDLSFRVQDAGEIMGIPLLDHIIVNGEGYLSMLELGALIDEDEIFKELLG